MLSPTAISLLAAALASLDRAAAAPATAAIKCYASTYATCSNTRVTGATSCVTGYYLNGGRCMPASAIPAGSYGSADGKVVNCGEGVKACSATGISSCQTSYFLTADKKSCVKSCPTSSFANTATSSCTACYSSIYKTCTNAKVTGATACTDGYALKGGRCMPNSLVPAGEYVKDGKVYACPAGQATCTSAGPSTCKTGYSLSSDGTSCVAKPACPAHADCDSTGKVVSCNDGWIYYLNSAGATACVDSRPAGAFLYVDRNIYVDSCPAKTWHYDMSTCYGPTCPQSWIDHELECHDCGENALTCDQNHAITCEPGFDTWGDDTGSYANCAYVACPDGSYAPGFSNACQPCEQEGAALCYPYNGRLLSCASGWVKSGDQCVRQCPDGEYAAQYSNGLACSSCRSYEENTVLTCDSDGLNSLTCVAGYSLGPDPWGSGLTLCIPDSMVA
ncbi:hypothetical protein JCM8097_001375 [Rhodosporidiobolus ruineniae]